MIPLGAVLLVSAVLFLMGAVGVLIRRSAVILGQIDVDSDETDPFTRAEEAEVRKVVDALAVLL